MTKTRRIDMRVTENEYDLILQKMKQCKSHNLSAYLLKMAIDGMIINLDMPELKEILRLLRYSGNNINQMAKKLNEGRNIYASDIAEIKENQTQILNLVRELYLKLSKI